ncbi:inositol monophosphatase family protein [Parasulfuritortus cantonensis]|uniref:Inositol monophosphatase family protein n=1 Tax=Parasulfuritortus cantonensis TaxID=2528202 RepID=A0A4R1B604_9PROT|nr:inositol monophosphatase family protein [Parasulfuritortus cantonensis]TCJ13000.1 inositol monophosphatase family protein [Parasulfuritortus cantonensis]
MPRYLKVAHARKDDGSLFTEADLAAQNALIERLRAIEPYPVLGEEMDDAAHKRLWQEGHDGLWCVDPIDGTTNFVSGMPFFAMSVALLRQGRPLLGVVYDPQADECFYAEAGAGAFVDGDRLPLKSVPERLERSIAGVDFKRIPRALAGCLAAEHPYSSQRNLGASTLDWCYLAAGRLHVYLHGGQKLWDYAAGALILTEAGGRVSQLDGAEFWSGAPWSRSAVAACTPELHAQWRDWLAARPHQ